MNILAIETSCDETSVAIVEDGYKIHASIVNSQIDIQKAFGGVVPEIAARSHIEVIIPVIKQALSEAKITWEDIDAIAVAQGPGLLGSLLIGTLTARTLAWTLNKPLIPVHHILGHVYANWTTEGPEYSTPYPATQPEFPVLALIVSGGHTQLMYAEDEASQWKVIGRTQDDAVGEAYDKVAKVLGLPYPGGISIEAIAPNGDPTKYPLPTPKVAETYGFSFSGLKTAVLRAVQKECGVTHEFPSFKLAELLSDAQKADFARSFQDTAINYLVSKTKRAFEAYNPKTVIIGGGVAASLPLRAALSKALPLEISYAPRQLCTDNAAMIGARAYFQAQNEEPADPRRLETKPSWPL
jgi:N6-L-threonylcarbamoyladenine synthase